MDFLTSTHATICQNPLKTPTIRPGEYTLETTTDTLGSKIKSHYQEILHSFSLQRLFPMKRILTLFDHGGRGGICPLPDYWPERKIGPGFWDFYHNLFTHVS